MVTQSKDLYEFSVDRLDNIGAQSKLKSMSVWMIAGSAVALFASAVVAFPQQPQGRQAILQGDPSPSHGVSDARARRSC